MSALLVLPIEDMDLHDIEQFVHKAKQLGLRGDTKVGLTNPSERWDTEDDQIELFIDLTGKVSRRIVNKRYRKEAS